LVFLQGVLDSTDELKAGMDEFFQNIEDKINTWADPNYEFPETSLTIDSMTSSQDTSDATSASNNFLQYHLVNNVGNASYVDNDDGNSENSTLLNLFNELMDALKQEKDIIEDALNRFYSEILEDNQYKTMSLVDLLKKSVSILAEAMLETAENIMDTFIDMIATIAQECISVLATPIWIPVLSDILDEFFDTSIPFSWLDVLLLVGAVPSTLVYKLLKGNTPFSDNDNYTNGLLNAKTLNDIYIALGTAKPMGTNMFRTSEFATQAGPSAGQEAIFEVSRILGGICSGVSALLVFPVNTPGIDNLKFFQISNAVSSMVGGFMNGLVQMFAQPVPIKNKLVSGFSSLLTAILVLEKAGFGVYVISRKKLGGASEAAQIVDRTITLAINCLTTVTALEHLYEILMDYETNPKLSNLAIGQIGTQFCGLGDSSANLSVMFVPEGLSKNVLLTCDTGLFAIKGVLQLAQGMYAAMTD
ncbi:MAG: hypothetical protein ACPG5P_04825, partial [Saprospiraceae bacterium]